jgi:hypothetical protein
MCADLDSDERNCGECGTACTGEEQCLAGECRCPSTDEVLCGEECVDTSSDELHCGECFAECRSPLQCSDGVCGCLDGTVECGAACVDQQTNSAHCGACFSACPAGTFCSAGRCVPEPLWADRIGASTENAALAWEDDGVVAVGADGGVVLAFARVGGGVVVRRYAVDGTLLWTRTVGSYARAVGAIAVDDAGRIALIAAWQLRWRTQSGVDRATLGFDDAAVLLLDPDGTIVWERFLATSGMERVGDVAFTAAGDVVAMGEFEASMDLGSGMTIYGARYGDLFLVTLRGSDGTTLHGRSYSAGSVTDSDAQLDIAEDGDRFIAGRSGTDGIDLGGGRLPYPSQRWIARIGPSAEHRWSRGLPVGSIDGVAAGPGDIVYVSGEIGGGTTDFGNGVALNVRSTSSARFVVALGASGLARWAVGVLSSYTEQSAGVVFDASADRVYTLATYTQLSGATGLPSFGGWDLALVAMNALDGRPLWTRTYGSSAADYGIGLAVWDGVLAFSARTEGTQIDLGGELLSRIDRRDIVVHALRP